ncbi:hypothetical protein [Afipia felis]
MSDDAKAMTVLLLWGIFAGIGVISTIGFIIRHTLPSVCSW